MTIDLWALVFMTMWTIVVVNVVPGRKMLSAGLSWGLSNREVDPEVPSWVGRAERTARNHGENLPMFMALVLVAHVSGEHDDVTAIAAVVYCVGRVAHAVCYWTGTVFLGLRTGAHYLALGALFVILSRLF